jgi:hypothetical protein
MRKVGNVSGLIENLVFESERRSWADDSQLSIVFDLMNADMAKALTRSDTFTPI